MQLHNLVQGSPEWDLFRLQHHGASEAAAMLGISPTTKRNELLKAKKTGLPKEFSRFVQERVLDKGHEVEALARPIVEELIGDDLYPVTCSDGKQSASCDGLTDVRKKAFEHKQWNLDLASMVADGVVPDYHMAQCQQILKVTGAEELIFVVSDGTRDHFVHTTIVPDIEWFNRIDRGWEQFDQDLIDFEPIEVVATPVGKAPETLPALRIEVTGMVTASNLAEFKHTALSAIHSVNRELTTDTHFADAEKAVKWCGDIEERIAAAKQHALSQTASIDELFRTMDDISAEARRVRLELDKLVKARKETIRGEIVAGGVAGLRDHIAALNARLGKPYMPAVPADFAGVIKGKRSIDSLRDAVDSELARAKIAASEIADRIDANLKYLREKAAAHTFLFADAATIVLKAHDDLKAMVTLRMVEHERTEAAKEEARREQIRQEEAAKLQREAAAHQAEQDAIAARRSQEEADAQRTANDAIKTAATPAVQTYDNGAPIYSTTTFKDNGEPIMLDKDGKRSVFCDLNDDLPTEKPTLKLGDVNARLGFTVTAEFLDLLGFRAHVERSSKLYRESDFPRICAAIVRHVQAVAQPVAA